MTRKVISIPPNPVSLAAAPISVVIDGIDTLAAIATTLTLANTEYTQALPVGAKSFFVQARDGEAFRVAFDVGDTAFDYVSVRRFGFFSQDGLTANSVNLYFRSDTANIIVETVVGY